MAQILNKLICLVRGHKWEEHWQRKYIGSFELDDAVPLDFVFYKCARCGKIKE